METCDKGKNLLPDGGTFSPLRVACYKMDRKMPRQDYLHSECIHTTFAWIPREKNTFMFIRAVFQMIWWLIKYTMYNKDILKLCSERWQKAINTTAEQSIVTDKKSTVAMPILYWFCTNVDWHCTLDNNNSDHVSKLHRSGSSLLDLSSIVAIKFQLFMVLWL